MQAKISDYLELCKPRVVLLMILTSIVGMYMATPHGVALSILIYGNLGIALVAGAAAAVNHLADQHIDRLMYRTAKRPLVQGKISPKNGIIFALGLFTIGFSILVIKINWLTAGLSLLSLMGYAVCYTFYLKHATPQNIVIGGIAGAAPPLLGWTAVTGTVTSQALLLVMIIFIWTPPHFWALAIYRVDEYAKAKVPMLPHTHGIAYTKLNVLLYTILLCVVTTLPFLISMSGWIYFIGVTFANAIFLAYAIVLYSSDNPKIAMKTFWYSIYYLGFLFVLLLVDHFHLLTIKR